MRRGHEQHVARHLGSDRFGGAADERLLELTAAQRSEHDELRAPICGRSGDHVCGRALNEIQLLRGHAVQGEQVVHGAPMKLLDRVGIAIDAGRDLDRRWRQVRRIR